MVEISKTYRSETDGERKVKWLAGAKAARVAGCIPAKISRQKSAANIRRFNFDDASVATDKRHRAPVVGGVIVLAGRRGADGRAGSRGHRVRDRPDGIRWPLAGAGVRVCAGRPGVPGGSAAGSRGERK